MYKNLIEFTDRKNRVLAMLLQNKMNGKYAIRNYATMTVTEFKSYDEAMEVGNEIMKTAIRLLEFEETLR